MMLVIQIVPAPYRIKPTRISSGLSIEEDETVPAPVKQILSRSCMDCHSGQTRVPWYGHVAPVSWLLARDVEKARAAMNLSEWAKKPPAVRMALALVACQDVRNGRMPPPSYLMMHNEARLSEADITAICRWSEQLRSQARLRRAR
jgi:cytochrome c